MQHVIGSQRQIKVRLSVKILKIKIVCLKKVIGLIGGLQNSLDMEKGGEIFENIYNLYAYIISQVTQVNIKNNCESLTEIISLISEIKSGWDGIPQDIRQQYNP